MSGQSANMSISEVKAMIKRTEKCPKPGEHQGKNKSNESTIMKREKQQG